MMDSGNWAGTLAVSRRLARMSEKRGDTHAKLLGFG